VITPSWLSGSWRSFLYSSSVYCYHLFLISSASVRSIPLLSFIEPIFAWNVPLVSLIFLKRSLIFPILLLSSVSLLWALMKAFLSLLAVLWNSALNGFIFPFLLYLFSSFLFSAICKASSENHFAFSLSCIGEGNGNPLQCSCLENPRDGAAWWAAISGVTQSRTRLKWLSSSSIYIYTHITESLCCTPEMNTTL